MSFGGENALAWAHAIVRDWFLAKFGSPTEPQEQGWPHILARHTTLIAAQPDRARPWRHFWPALIAWSGRRWLATFRTAPKCCTSRP